MIILRILTINDSVSLKAKKMPFIPCFMTSQDDINHDNPFIIRMLRTDGKQIGNFQRIGLTFIRYAFHSGFNVTPSIHRHRRPVDQCFYEV